MKWLFRFGGDGKYHLPVSSSKSEIIRIKKIDLSDFSQLPNGNNFQFLGKPTYIQKTIANETLYFKDLPEKISKEEAWRYCIGSIPLTKN